MAWALAAAVALGAGAPAAPADRVAAPEVVAAGLTNPRGLAFAPDGRLLVTEAGTGGSTATEDRCPHSPAPIGPFRGGPTARLSAIAPDGARTTVAAGLPSGATAPESGREVMGAEEVGFLAGVPYVLVQGGGCAKGNPDQPLGLYRITPDGSHDVVADLGAWFAAHPTAGPPDEDNDPEGVPTSMVVGTDRFYVLEGNNAQLVEVRLDGSVRRIADLSVLGHRTYTALERERDGTFWVGTFSELPYPDGTAELLRVGPDGTVTPSRSGFSTIIDIRLDRHGRLHVLESSRGNAPHPPFLVPGTGRVLRVTGDAVHEIATGLSFPTAMRFAPDGDLYVSDRAYGVGRAEGRGQVVRIPRPGR